MHQVHDGVDHLHAGNQEQNAGGQRDPGRLPELEDDGAGRRHGGRERGQDDHAQGIEFQP